ncbi:MAG: tetratricopeptide repeat protein [Planctomycetaceae bacterium]
MAPLRETRRAGRWIDLIVVAAALVPSAWQSAGAQQPVLPPGTGSPRGMQTVPTPGYDAALTALAAGETARALEISTAEYRSGIRVGSRRWLDSVAMAAVIGECEYETGRIREAVAAYEEALLLAAQHGDWLLAVRFPSTPLQAAVRPKVATWYRGRRATRQAAIPPTALIQHAGSDPQEVLQKGGVLSAAFSSTVRPEEIVRAIEIALYRRSELLGELARDGTALQEIARVLQRRPAPPNHFSQAWIDVLLGTAYFAQGKSQQAVPLLERGMSLADGLDHGLTGWALIVLGRIALESGNADAAATLFEDAAAAAAEARDARAVEEALRLAFASRMAGGDGGVPAAIGAACEWARGELPALRANLLALEAEALAITGDAPGAVARLKAIDPRILQVNQGRGGIAAQAAYANALAAFAAGDNAAGTAEFDRALAIARPRSPRLHQLGLAVERSMAGAAGMSDRQADALFSRLLADPAPREFGLDPLASLTVISTPRQEAFDAWLVAAARRGSEAFLAASDAATRARWLVRQPFGGRRMAIERILDADPAALDAPAATRRAALLARSPDLSRLLADTQRIRTGLSTAILERGGDAADTDAVPSLPGAAADWQAFLDATARRRGFVDVIAAGRDPTVIDFPPAAGADVRARLRPREMVLSFHWTATGLYGALESRDRVALWQVPQPAAVYRELATLFREIGLFEGTVPVTSDNLSAGRWRDSVATLERLLFEPSRVALGAGIDDLVIVPDGPLWYLPFDLLPVGSGADDDARRPLGEICRTRISPTRGLVCLRTAAPRAAGALGIHAGRRTRGARIGESDWVVDHLSERIDRVLPLPSRTPARALGLAASLCENLLVLDEMPLDAPIGPRPLLVAGVDRGADRSPAGVTFADWLGAPAKRPRCVILPDVQTPMVEATAAGRGGEELFEIAMTLLAAGAERALVSRWRMAGRASVDLIGEFLIGLDESDREDAAELSPPGAASWRRAVEIVGAEAPDLAAEPRIRPDPDSRLVDARHPLFWAGYMVIEPGSASKPRGPR